MATELSPELHIEHFKPKPDSQASTTLEQKFLTPLEDSQVTRVSSNWDRDLLPPLSSNSQDTHDLGAPEWSNDASSHEVNVASSQPKPNAGNFLSRPTFESPLDLQIGFQYSKAPTSHRLSSRQDPSQNGVEIQANIEATYLNNGKSASEASSPQTSEAASNSSGKSHGAKGQDRETTLKTNVDMIHKAPSFSDPPFDAAQATHEQPSEVYSGRTTLKASNQSSSHLDSVSTPLRQIRARVDSPATKSARLPKGFEDIRRKALIQVKHTNRLSPSIHRQKPQIIEAPARFGSPDTRAPLENKHTHTQRRQNDLDVESFDARTDLFGAWNRHFGLEAKRNAHWKEKMEDMIEQLAERDERVAEYLEQIRLQDQIIADLEIARQRDLTTHQEQDVAITELDEQRQKLREKVKEYKQRLNDATNEQQSIFKYFQPRYHELREQMKQAEIKHQEALKQALSVNEQVKNKIQKSVKEIKTLSQQEIHNLRSEIGILQVKLAEREKEVDREKLHVNELRRELDESHACIRSSLECLNTQNQALMKKSDASSTQAQNIQQSIQDQENHFESLQKVLEDDKAARQTPSELMKNLEMLQEDAVNGILQGLHERAEADREWSSKTTEELKKDVQGVREFCTNLSERLESSLDASEWQQKFSDAQMNHHAALWEADQLREKIASMHNQARTQREQQETLQREYDSLSASIKVTDAVENEIKALQIDRQKAQKCLVEKESLIRTLEDKLRETTATLGTKECQLKEQERKLQDEEMRLTNAIASSHEKHDKALRQAKEECTRTQMKYRDVENRLRNAEQTCSRLEEEVVQANLRAKYVNENGECEAAKQAQALLVPIANQIEKASAALRISQQTDSDLNARLDAWSKSQVEVSLLRQALQKLAKDFETNTEDGNLLAGFLDVQKKLDDTWKWHKSEVDALYQATELEKSEKADAQKSIRLGHKENHHISRVLHRRVMIHSPDIDHDQNQRVAPLSIEEERVTRRQAAPLKGIMKPASLQAEGEHHLENLTSRKSRRSLSRQATSGDEKPTLVSHSAYNRPVLGSASNFEGYNVDSTVDEAETAVTEILLPRKRKWVNEGDERQNVDEKTLQPGRRVKLSNSMLTDRRVHSAPVVSM
ncbi:hypothetical protein NPX13_g4375 [Xylaria arbuscula]|uniref:Uncharacterized protein n=1 Tax=Xylaria arbuscula TaxID=114810 RepID=A0A9W8TNE6_9PEZI|nr:hypothetical protein NPX13_g4375 [Xylaria arbuscula]